MSNLDEIQRAVDSLQPDDKLTLIARLWSSLPIEHKAKLVMGHRDDGPRPAAVRYPIDEPVRPIPLEPNPIWPVVYRLLFDPETTSGLYSAPRRFDLATIFVVTAAYSILFGALSFERAEPWIMVSLGLLITAVAVAQSLFDKVANPRGVSVVAGAAATVVIGYMLWLTFWRQMPRGSFLLIPIFGTIGGAFMGYLAGALVGGVFLVADMVRKRYFDHAKVEAETTTASSPESDKLRESPWAN